MFRARARRQAISNLTPEEREIVAKPWLNTFPAITDWRSEQTPEDKLRQIEKSSSLYRHIRDVIHRAGSNPRGLLVTSTDGYFVIYTLYAGAASVDVYDVCDKVPGHEAWHLDQMRIVAKVRGHEERTSFQRAELDQISGSWDFCVVTEVLENMADPEAAIAKIRELVKGPMALFSSTRTPNDPSFFESPTEARPWGCAFSHDMLIKIVVEAGWTVVNERLRTMPEDWRGERDLSYLHCV